MPLADLRRPTRGRSKPSDSRPMGRLQMPSSNGVRFSATTSPHMANLGESPTLQDALASECSRTEEDCLYSSKGCFEAARTWHRAHLGLGIPTVIAAGIAGVSAFNDHPIAAGTLAVMVAALSSVSTFLNPSEKEHTYQSVGNRYNSLR